MTTIADREISETQRTSAGIGVGTLLALLAMVGPLYIDIMPSIVAALRTDWQLSPAQAGFVAASNGYGSTVGALLSLFVVGRLPWKPFAALLLTALCLTDFATTYTQTYEGLVAVRFAHGVAGGILVGICYSLIAQTAEPRTAFGILFAFHFGFGGLGILISSYLIPELSHGVVFLVLAAFDALALLILPFIPAFHGSHVSSKGASAFAGWFEGRRLMRVGALFLFQAANLGFGAFLIGSGTQFGHSASFAGGAVGLGLWAGLPGALAMLFLTRRFGWGALVPVVIAAALSKSLVALGQSPILFAIANASIFLTMAMALSFTFAICSDGDKSGRWAAMAGFASKLGLSTGPAIGGLVYPNGLGAMITVAVSTALVAALLFGLSLRPRSATQTA